MRTLNEMNRPFEIQYKSNQNRLKLIVLDRRLNHLNRIKAKNGLERFGLWLQRVGIRMQIKGVLQRMKTQNGNTIK